MMRVLLWGLSMPLSMMVVATSTSHLAASGSFMHHVLDLLGARSGRAPRPRGPRARRSSTRGTRPRRWSSRGCTRSTPGRRARAPRRMAAETTSASHSPAVHLHGTAPRRRRHDQAHVAHAAHRHLHRARDGRGRQREHVDLLAHVLELLLVLDAETLLLVDDDEAQVMRIHVRWRAGGGCPRGPLTLPLAKPSRAGLLLHWACGSGESTSTSNVERREAVEERLEVLLGEDRRGTEHHDLTACPATHLKAARRATSVLPKPTSPQSRRSIGLGRSPCRT